MEPTLELNLKDFQINKIFTEEDFNEFWGESYGENIVKTFGEHVSLAFKDVAMQSYKIGCMNAMTKILCLSANRVIAKSKGEETKGE